MGVKAASLARAAARVSGDIQLKSHVQRIGWQDWVVSGGTSGTSGRSLRVEALQSRAQWPELLRLAQEWSAGDPDDADAWYARGVAQSRLGRPDDAKDDLARATTLAPRHAAAWFELGAAQLEAGDPVRAGLAREVLAELGSPLAEQLASRIALRSQSTDCVGCGSGQQSAPAR